MESVDRKSLKGDMKCRGILLNWLIRIHTEGGARACTSVAGDKERGQRARWEGVLLTWLSRICVETGLGRPKTGWGSMSRPGWKEGSEEPDYSLVKDGVFFVPSRDGKKQHRRGRCRPCPSITTLFLLGPDVVSESFSVALRSHRCFQ